MSAVGNIVDHVASHLDNNPLAKTVHLSPIADPFQPAEGELGLSVRVMQYCASRSLALAVCTKAIIPEAAQSLLQLHPDSFAQISILTPDEAKRKFLVRGGGASTDELLRLAGAMVGKGILVIARVDPIFPLITDDMADFRRLAKGLQAQGVKHIVSSIADICGDALDREMDYLDGYRPGLGQAYRDLYTETIGGRLHADESYRRRLFGEMLGICQHLGLSFGITWEPSLGGESLAQEFSVGAPQHLRERLT